MRAQLLAEPRPTNLLEVVRHLGLVQNDPAVAVAPSAEIVMWTRLGAVYRVGDLERATAAGDLVELAGNLHPAEDIALHRAQMVVWPGAGKLRDWELAQQGWVEANDDCRRDILELLHDGGPLPSSALPDTTLVPWQSSGWNNDRNVRMLLDLMVRRGEVAAAGWEGRVRLWDLAERVYPDDPLPAYDEAMQVRANRRLHALGLARERRAESPYEPDRVGEAGEQAVVEGVRGRWRVDPAYLEGLDDFTARVVLVSPIDRLIFDRKRMADLFEFDYQLEMYKPAAKRRWGYWAMPILDGDRFVGKLDATADRERGVLQVDAVHEDEPFSRRLRMAVGAEIDALADWLDLVRG